MIRPIPLDKKQKWPLFGERLINGNINEEIYQYETINHREDICLLEILFPSKYNKENNNQIFDNDNSGFEYNKSKVNNIMISEYYRKRILIKLINDCFGEKNNYQLFKYIYLMPSKSLVYNNLYEEIKLYLKE